MILQILVFLQSDILESSPVVRLEYHHVVQQAAGAVTQLVRLGHRGQHLLGHRQKGTVADEAKNLLLLILNTNIWRLLFVLTQLLFIIYEINFC